jgi:hypothetical protein
MRVRCGGINSPSLSTRLMGVKRCSESALPQSEFVTLQLPRGRPLRFFLSILRLQMGSILSFEKVSSEFVDKALGDAGISIA